MPSIIDLEIMVFDIIFGVGIDKLGELITLASDMGIVKKSGSWYAYEETKLGQGIESVKSILKDNEELLEEIELRVRKKLQ